MSKGISTLQRRILEVLPVGGDGADADAFASHNAQVGVCIREIAFHVGRFNVFELSKDLEVLRLQLALGVERGRRYITHRQHFTVWRALRSLEQRGLAKRARWSDGGGDSWWRIKRETDLRNPGRSGLPRALADHSAARYRIKTSVRFR